MTKIITNYVTFKDILNDYMSYTYKPTSEWYTYVVKGLNNYYGDECFNVKEGAQDFYKALGIKLNDSSVFYLCEQGESNVEQGIMSKLSRVCNKSEILLDEYLPLYNKLQEDIKTLESHVTSRFNDTPTSLGNYTSDKYTSTITQVTNSQDYDINTQVSFLKEKMRGLVEQYLEQFEVFKIWTN